MFLKSKYRFEQNIIKIPNTKIFPVAHNVYIGFLCIIYQKVIFWMEYWRLSRSFKASPRNNLLWQLWRIKIATHIFLERNTILLWYQKHLLSNFDRAYITKIPWHHRTREHFKTWLSLQIFQLLFRREVVAQPYILMVAFKYQWIVARSLMISQSILLLWRQLVYVLTSMARLKVSSQYLHTVNSLTTLTAL